MVEDEGVENVLRNCIVEEGIDVEDVAVDVFLTIDDLSQNNFASEVEVRFTLFQISIALYNMLVQS